jgi:hypothetical protein
MNLEINCFFRVLNKSTNFANFWENIRQNLDIKKLKKRKKTKKEKRKHPAGASYVVAKDLRAKDFPSHEADLAVFYHKTDNSSV